MASRAKPRENAERSSRVFRTGLGYAILSPAALTTPVGIGRPIQSAKRRRMTLTRNATAFIPIGRWHRFGSFSPSGLTRHLSGMATHALRRGWLRATIYGRDRPRAAPTLDYGALRRVVPMVTGDAAGLLRIAREALEGRAEILGYGLLEFSYR